MAIEGGTGEVVTRSQFERTMEGIRANATANLEAAQGDLKRAREETNQFELMNASLDSAEIDSETRMATREMLATGPEFEDAARRVVAVNERRAALSEKAMKTLAGAKQTQFHSN